MSECVCVHVSVYIDTHKHTVLSPVEDEYGEDAECGLVEQPSGYLALRHTVQDVVDQVIRDVDLCVRVCACACCCCCCCWCVCV